ncbi:hypothetical protein H4582DRAFT_2150808 [Lactarius indigo]|nr:hypothetical protein H4582DRAFT_2150808 [Lactarius indigo]
MSADGSDDKKSPVDNTISNINAKLANPLAGLSHEELMDSGAEFARTHGLGHLEEEDPLAFENIPYFTEDDKNIFRRELDTPLGPPWDVMDEAVINGANLFFAPQFHIDSKNEWLLGLVNSAPYGVTNSWPHLFVARFFLGLGIGPKSSTVPVYAAECAPPAIRGALVMMWQMWTAFGIMLGYVADLAFYKGLNWRLMLASAGIPALFLMAQVFFCPESPRWLISKNRYPDAYRSLERLRRHPTYTVLLEAEKELTRGRNRYLELFTIPRNRRATLGSFIVMFMQQFCGVNVIAYYSSTIFTQANFTEIQALLASLGIWRTQLPGSQKATVESQVVALGVYLFDCVYSPGEGPVPFTYSAEAFPLYIRDVGMSFATAVTWLFNFVVAITFPRLLGAVQAPGSIRDGMLRGTLSGSLLYCSSSPRQKQLSLEELDQGTLTLPTFSATAVLTQDLVFSVPTQTHAAYQIKALPHNIKKYIFRMKVDPLPPLYEHEGAIGEKHYAPGGAGHA